jgi:hypothetical protein
LRDFGTRELAEKLGATHFLDREDWMSAVKTAAVNSATRITVNLSGFSGSSTWSQVMGAVGRGVGGAPKYTEWEMAQSYQAGLEPGVASFQACGRIALGRTTRCGSLMDSYPNVTGVELKK